MEHNYKKRGKGLRNLALEFQDINASFLTHYVKMDNYVILLSFILFMGNENMNLPHGTVGKFIQTLVCVPSRMVPGNKYVHTRCWLLLIIIAVLIVSILLPPILPLMSDKFSEIKAEHRQSKD